MTCLHLPASPPVLRDCLLMPVICSANLQHLGQFDGKHGGTSSAFFIFDTQGRQVPKLRMIYRNQATNTAPHTRRQQTSPVSRLSNTAVVSGVGQMQPWRCVRQPGAGQVAGNETSCPLSLHLTDHVSAPDLTTSASS